MDSSRSKQTGHQDSRLCLRACIVIYSSTRIPERMPFIAQHMKPFWPQLLCVLFRCRVSHQISNQLTDRRSIGKWKDESRYVQECGTTASWRLSDAHAHKQDPIFWRRQRRSHQCFRVCVSLIISIKSNIPAKRIRMLKQYSSSWTCFVYRIEGTRLVMIYVTKKTNKSFTIDPLLLHDENAHHYVLILNLERFVAYFESIAHRAAQRICRNCFHLCTNGETCQNHAKTCSEHAAAESVMPKESNTSLQFRNWKALWFLPIVLYFGTKFYFVPITTAQPSPSTCYTIAIEKHEPCGYVIAAIEHGKATAVYFELKRGDKCLNEFVKSLRVLAYDIYNRRRAFYGLYRGPVPALENNTRCWVCENEINNEAELVLEQFHFLGWAHQLCNTRRRTSNATPMIGHYIKKSMILIIYVSH